MVQIIEARGLGGSGGGGFVLGNEPNTFADNAARDAQAAGDAAWLAAYDANKTLVVRVGSGSSFNYFRRPITPTGTDDWEDVTSIITGPPGMGAIPQSIPDGTLLRAFDNNGTIEVAASSARDVSTGIELDGMLMTLTNGIQMGAQGGTQLSAATDDLTYKTPLAEEHILISQVYDRTNGASKPQRQSFGAAAIFSVANGTGTPFTGKQTIIYTSAARGFIRAFRFRPTTAGTARIRAYVGPSEAAGVIVADVSVTVEAGDVNTIFDTDTHVFNPGDSAAGTETVITIEGVNLDGGVSSSSVTSGQSLPYFDAVFHSNTEVELVDRVDFPQANQDRLGALVTAGNPAADGQFLSGTTAGVFNWVNQPSSTDDLFEDQVSRRLSSALSFSGTELDPGTMVNFDTGATGDQTLTVPASSTDGQLLSRWGIKNTKISGRLTLDGDGTAGHTFILEGGAFPAPLPNGTFWELVCVARATNSTTYRLVALENVGGAPITEQGVIGDSLVIVPPTSSRSEVNVSGIADANFPVTLSGVGGIASFTAHEVIINNDSTTRAANLAIGGNLTFGKTSTQRLVIPPASSIPFIWRNNSGSPEITPAGPVEYEFIMTTNDIVGNGATDVNWTGIPDTLDHLVYSPASGQTNANALITRPGVGCFVEMQLEWLGGWGGSTGLFQDGTIVDVQPRVNNVNDSMGTAITYTQWHRSGAPVSHSRTWAGSMAAGDLLTLTTTNLESSGPRMIEVQAYVKLRFKTL